MLLLPITALSTAGRKAAGPPGPAVLQLSTCGVGTTDAKAESETWHCSVLWWGWGIGWCTGGGGRFQPPVFSSRLPPLTLHYLQVLYGWRHKLLSALYG